MLNNNNDDYNDDDDDDDDYDALNTWLEGDSLAPPCQAELDVVEKLIEFANPSNNDVFCDIGCGDGRICIAASKRYGCSSIGIEIEDKLIERFKIKLNKQNVDIQSKVTILHQDLRDVDLSSVTILVMYLLQESIEEIKPLLLTALERGTVIICNTWGPKGLEPVDKISCGFGGNVNLFKYTKQSLNKMKAQELKLRGNELFQEKNFIKAIETYAEAIEMTADTISKAILYSNRAACYLSLKNYVAAAEDSQKAITLDVGSLKSYFRLATALSKLNQFAEASKVCDLGLTVDPTSSALLQLKQKSLASQSDRLQESYSVCSTIGCTDHDSSMSQFCMSCSTNNSKTTELKALSMHEILASKAAFSHLKFSTNEILFLNCLRQLVKKIVNYNLHDMEYLNMLQINPTFRKLMDSSQFADIVFPGTPTTALKSLPKSLRDLLMWKELAVDIRKMVLSANTIFENVSAKGSSRGDSMNEETKNILVPLIMQEAMARELITAVRDLGKVLSNVKAKTSLTLASTTAEEAGNDYLDSNTVSDLCDSSKCIAEFHNFLGSDFQQLLLEEVTRYVSNEKMTPITNDDTILSRVAWIEADAVEVYYPVLSEVIKQLHALPYEINAKSNNSLSLMQPTKGCTMLSYFPVDGSQPSRIDNAEEGKVDSGLMVSCAYHFFDNQVTVPNLQYRHINNNEIKEIAINNDHLILHQSTKIYTQRDSAINPYFVIYYFIHGFK